VSGLRILQQGDRGPFRNFQ